MPIRVQIVQGRGLISKAIMFSTRGWASHAELVSGNWTLGERANGGLQTRKLDVGEYRRVEQFVLNSPDSARSLEKAWHWLMMRRGTPYNYRGIFGLATDLNVTNPKAMDCSHAVFSAMWLGAGFPLLSTRPSNVPWRITPRDLLLSRGLVYAEKP